MRQPALYVSVSVGVLESSSALTHDYAAPRQVVTGGVVVLLADTTDVRPRAAGERSPSLRSVGALEVVAERLPVGVASIQVERATGNSLCRNGDSSAPEARR